MPLLVWTLVTLLNSVSTVISFGGHGQLAGLHSQLSCTVSGHEQSAVVHSQQSCTVRGHTKQIWVADSAQRVHPAPQICVARLCIKSDDKRLAQQELLVTQCHTVGASD